MVTCLTSYLGQARIRDVTCCVSPLPRELYAEEEFDCLQIEEHLSRHVTPCRRKGKCFVFFLFLFPPYRPFPRTIVLDITMKPSLD